MACVPLWRPPAWTTGRSVCTTRCTRWACDQVPSTASLARIFREAGVARLEPKKKPRSAWRRFVYPAPNACWQLDATEYVLSGGRTCVIFQLIDDHSRYASPPTSPPARPLKDAITVWTKPSPPTGTPTTPVRQRARAQPVAARVPRPTRQPRWRLWAWRRSPASPTSRPPKARTNASTRPCSATSTNSRSPRSLAELQAQVDAFDHIYNTQRPHQGLPGRVTPLTAWEATPKAEPPRPKPDRPVYAERVPSRYSSPEHSRPRSARRHPCHEREHRRHHHAGLSHLQSRCPTRLSTGPRRQRWRQDHHHRSARRSPRRTHPTRTRRQLRRQRPTPRPTPQDREPSPKS